MSKLYDLLYAMIGKLNSSVKTTAQTLTDAEKTQARANIGAQPAGDYAEKKDIPTVPTKVSAFTNDAGYLTQHQDLSAYAKKTEIPSKLPNPHALTINGKTYDGSSAVSVKVEGGSGGAQADWNAARGLPGHVLHRTHWVDESGTVLLDDDAVGFADGSALIDDVQLVAGASYIITYNGETEECVAVDDGLGSIMLRPNNLPVDFNYEAPNDEMGVSEAFRIYPHDFEESEAAIKIVLNSGIIHPLDKKFLPDNIGGADWNAAEGEPGHVLNRTHWVEGCRVEVLAECQPEYIPDMGNYTIPVSSILTAGESIIVNWNGTEYSCVLQDMSEFFPGTVGFGDLTLMGIESSNGEPFFGTWMDSTETGRIVVLVPLDDTTELTVSIYQDNEVVHKLDPKFLPDGVPYMESGMVEILPECQPVYDEGEGSFYGIVFLGVVSVGDTCIVNWNGTEYECVAQDLSAMAVGAVLLGDGTNFGATGNGEPFMFVLMEQSGVFGGMIVPLDGTTELTVSVRGNVKTYHKLDKALLPAEAVNNVLVVTIKPERDENGNHLATHNFIEIISAIESGKAVFLLMNGDQYTYAYRNYDAQLVYFISTRYDYSSANGDITHGKCSIDANGIIQEF